MADDMNNPLDDDLLRELGLDPKDEPSEPVQKVRSPGQMPKDHFDEDDLFSDESLESDFDQEVSSDAEPPLRRVAPERQSVSESFSSDVKKITENMPIKVVAVLGKKSMTLNEIVSLKPGEIVNLKKLPNDYIDLVANGKLVARGELVLIDGKLGLQIKQLSG